MGGDKPEDESLDAAKPRGDARPLARGVPVVTPASRAAGRPGGVVAPPRRRQIRIVGVETVERTAWEVWGRSLKSMGIACAILAAMAGVRAVYTGADLGDLWAAPMPCAWPVTEDMLNPPHHPIATDTVNYVGDGVAGVLAASDAIAHDALHDA
jgi:hypothetical protein